MREEDDLEGEREDEEEAEEEGPEREWGARGKLDVDSWLFVRGRGLFSLARFEGEGGSVAFPLPLSIVFAVDSSSSSIGSSVCPPLIAFRLNSDPSTSTCFPLVVAILLVELPALCLAVPILFPEFFPFDLSCSFPVTPPPSSCIFLLNKACAVPPEADPSRVEDEEGLRERGEVEVETEEEEGPTNN
jgi:hypothetical protein